MKRLIYIKGRGIIARGSARDYVFNKALPSLFAAMRAVLYYIKFVYVIAKRGCALQCDFRLIILLEKQMCNCYIL